MRAEELCPAEAPLRFAYGRIAGVPPAAVGGASNAEGALLPQATAGVPEQSGFWVWEAASLRRSVYSPRQLAGVPEPSGFWVWDAALLRHSVTLPGNCRSARAIGPHTVRKHWQGRPATHARCGGAGAGRSKRVGATWAGTRAPGKAARGGGWQPHRR